MKGKKSGGKNWKPGQSGNPNGRPLLPGDIKESRKFNAIEATRIITRYLCMTALEIAAAVENPNTTAMELVLAKVIVEAGKTGDYQRLNFLFDRTIGKVSDKLKVTLPKPTVIKLIDEDAAVVVGSYQDDEDDEADEAED